MNNKYFLLLVLMIALLPVKAEVVSIQDNATINITNSNVYLNLPSGEFHFLNANTTNYYQKIEFTINRDINLANYTICNLTKDEIETFDRMMRRTNFTVDGIDEAKLLEITNEVSQAKADYLKDFIKNTVIPTTAELTTCNAEKQILFGENSILENSTGRARILKVLT